MKFKMVRDGQTELGARIEDVAQEAIDVAVLAYSNDSGTDVRQRLRIELSSRAIAAADEETLAELESEILAGQRPSVGRADGSVDGRYGPGEGQATRSVSNGWVDRFLRATHLRR